ncbi:MAG: glycosyltransferase family 2 protein [bacterium]
MPQKPKTLLVIPAYNEQKTLPDVLRQVRAVMPDLDVLVVDDGSSDRTARLARAAGVQVLSHPFNMGYGVAVQTGFKAAFERGYERVAQMDGDGQHDPNDLPKLLGALEESNADLVLGSRYLGRANYRIPFVRKLGMKIFAALASAMIGQKITDPTTGYQAFTRRVLGFFCSDLYPVDYPDADLLIMVHYRRLRICEVPVTMGPNPEQRSMHSGILRPMYYVFKMFLSIAVTRLRKRDLEERRIR